MHPGTHASWHADTLCVLNSVIHCIDTILKIGMLLQLLTDKTISNDQPGQVGSKFRCASHVPLLRALTHGHVVDMTVRVALHVLQHLPGSPNSHAMLHGALL